MSITGIDYSFSHPSPSAITAAGAHFVCRYLAPINSSTSAKVLTRAEAEALHVAGLSIGIVWEWTADRAAQGRTAGVADARAAQAQASALGADDVPLYFAVDFDASAAQLAPSGAVYQYAAGWASVVGASSSGVYGGYATVKALMSAGLCRYGWQAIAWSGGHWYAGAQIRQTGAGKIAGHSIDWNTATSSDYGAWAPEEDDMTPAQAAQLTAIQQAVTGTGIASAGYRLIKNGKSAEPGGATDVHQVWGNTANGVTKLIAMVGALQSAVAALAKAVGTAGGLTAEQITAAAQAGAQAALEQLGDALTSDPAS